jgi:hypothetical protein
VTVDPLRDLADAARALADRRRGRLTDRVQWLPLQDRFLRSPARVKQIRAGNQGIGKTWPALAEVIGHCEGRHVLRAYPVPPPPVEWWVVCASWSQSLGIQAKLHELLPHDAVDWDRTSYDRAAGFSPTKQPVVVFRNGSLIRIKTTGQDSLDFAGSTLSGIMFDEPPRSMRLFVEALQRVEELGGKLILSYTPINADVSFLLELVESGQIEDHHARLTPDQLIPVGGAEPLRTRDGRPKDAAWVAYREASVPTAEREVVIHGEWPGDDVSGAYFAGAWDPEQMVWDAIAGDDDDLVLGIDHGDRPGKQYAVLLAVDDTGEMPVVHALDEYVDETGRASPADDARGILAMLSRHGADWSRLKFAGGDRVHLPGTGAQKSNRDLEAQIAKLLRVPQRGLRPQIRTVKAGEGRGAGAPSVGCRWLWQTMTGRRFTVHPRCKRLLTALPRFVLRPGLDDEHKDAVDGVRYALDPWIFRRRRITSGGPVRVW